MLNLNCHPLTPEWVNVFQKLSAVECDPELRENMKRAVLDLILQAVRYNIRAIPVDSLKCLRNFGSFPKSARLKEKKEFQPIIPFTTVLENFVYMLGKHPDACAFLRALKEILWRSRTGNMVERCMVLHQFGSLPQKVFACWSVLLDFDRLRGFSSSAYIAPSQEQEPFLSCYNLVREYCVLEKHPGWENMKWSCPLYSYKSMLSTCHSYIVNDDISLFVLNVMKTKRALSKADFLGILYYERPDFLEYLFMDLPDKRLPLSTEAMAVLFATNPQTLTAFYMSNPKFSDDMQLKALQLLEKKIPGAIGKFEDPFGRNLLWYTLYSMSDKPYMNNGKIKLTPAQRFLYDLCDHAKPDCTGISFDDLINEYRPEWF